MRRRVAIRGFSDSERIKLTFSLWQAVEREPGYEPVERFADCDFIVADASQDPPPGGVPQGNRLYDTLFVGDKVPPGAGASIPRPIDTERLLQALDAMAARREAPPAQANLRVDTPPAADAGLGAQPGGGEAVTLHLIDLDAAGTVAAGAAPPAPPGAPTPARRAADERAAAKDAARRATRRARITQAGALTEPPLREVLVLDSESAAGELNALLEMFGFQVYRAVNSAHAMALLGRLPLAAAFLDVDPCAPGDLDGLELCQQIKQHMLSLAGTVPPVMLLANELSATDRVRARLAGCDALLTRPVRRGDVARALEACRVTLPADARRH